jgi:hypothetical protein
MVEEKNACKILVGKPEGKRPLRRPRFRWMDSIKMDLREIGWNGMDSIDLAQERNNLHFPLPNMSQINLFLSLFSLPKMELKKSVIALRNKRNTPSIRSFLKSAFGKSPIDKPRPMHHAILPDYKMADSTSLKLF